MQREKQTNKIALPARHEDLAGQLTASSAADQSECKAGHGYSITNNWPTEIAISDEEISIILNHLTKEIADILDA